MAGSVDKPRSHLQPRVGITVRARRTSKHAPNAQKLCQTVQKKKKYDRKENDSILKNIQETDLHQVKLRTCHVALPVEILHTTLL